MKRLLIILTIGLLTLTSCEKEELIDNSCECRWEERITSERVDPTDPFEPVSDYILVEPTDIKDCFKDGITEPTTTGERTLICEREE